jgi:glutamine amidotransferase
MNGNVDTPLRVTLFDYGAGNLHSLLKTVDAPDIQLRVETDATRLLIETDALILPGVGAFAHAAARLEPGREAVAAALEDGMPALCICLGMQLLFDESDEGPGAGLGLLGGRVTRLHSARIPQIGWNDVEWPATDDTSLDIAYYANSFVCRPDAQSREYVVGWSEHDGDRFPAVVRYRETLGAQFHPEKSSGPGVQFVKQFLDRARTVRNTDRKADR